MPDDSHKSHQPKQVRPRTAANAESPGNYELATRALNTEIDPGDTVTVELFVTGYGAINGAKLACYPPLDFVDTRNSSITVNLFPVFKDGKCIFEGKTISMENDDQVMVIFGGLLYHGEEYPTTFFDVKFSKAGEVIRLNVKNVNNIYTERRSGSRAPMEVTLKTRSDAKPGLHHLTFLMTYFNGAE